MTSELVAMDKVHNKSSVKVMSKRASKLLKN